MCASFIVSWTSRRHVAHAYILNFLHDKIDGRSIKGYLPSHESVLKALSIPFRKSKDEISYSSCSAAVYSGLGFSQCKRETQYIY